MTEERGLLIRRNVVAFVVMVAVSGAVLFLVNYSWAWFDIRGIHRFTTAFAADALCGVAGYFLFTGGAALRTWLIFFAVIAMFAASVVFFYDPGRGFYPLLTSLPFAAVAALAARITGFYVDKRRIRDRGA